MKETSVGRQEANLTEGLVQDQGAAAKGKWEGKCSYIPTGEHCPYGDRCMYDHGLPRRQQQQHRDVKKQERHVENDPGTATDTEDEKHEEFKSRSRKKKHIYCKYVQTLKLVISVKMMAAAWHPFS